MASSILSQPELGASKRKQLHQRSVCRKFSIDTLSLPLFLISDAQILQLAETAKSQSHANYIIHIGDLFVQQKRLKVKHVVWSKIFHLCVTSQLAPLSILSTNFWP